jgi:hypothetical protein
MPRIVNPAQVTGHLYELRYKTITNNNSSGNNYTPFYTYDLWDVDLSTIVLADRKISVPQIEVDVWDVPPAVDGIVFETKTRVNRITFNPDSFRISQDVNISNPLSTDTLVAYGSVDQYWSMRGADYEVRWHVKEGATDSLDTLWAEVWDATNNVEVPCDTVNSWMSMATSAWSFGPTASAPGKCHITSQWPIAARSFIYICGSRYYFNRGTAVHRISWATKPEEGEIWTAYTSGDRPPHEGDVYGYQSTVGVAGRPEDKTKAFVLKLNQNHPNPFSVRTTIQYVVPGACGECSKISLKIYNITGQLVRTLVEEQKNAGFYETTWHGRDKHDMPVANGVYICKLSMANGSKTIKMIIIK